MAPTTQTSLADSGQTLFSVAPVGTLGDDTTFQAPSAGPPVSRPVSAPGRSAPGPLSVPVPVSMPASLPAPGNRRSVATMVSDTQLPPLMQTNRGSLQAVALAQSLLRKMSICQ